jgi:hypothetical protein
MTIAIRPIMPGEGKVLLAVVRALAALLKALAAEATKLGFPSIYWLMMGWNVGARALYLEAGAECDEGMCYYRLSDDALIRLAESPL